jgi:SsrA-binding protein
MTEIVNKGVLRSYEILKKYTAGIKLLGEEVKALRYHGGNLGGSYITVRENTPYLIGLNIPKYKKSSNNKYVPKRVRTLLLNKIEITNIKLACNNVGTTVIPLKVYFEEKLVKVDIAVAKGLTKQGQKRLAKEKQQIKDTQREAREY